MGEPFSSSSSLVQVEFWLKYLFLCLTVQFEPLKRRDSCFWESPDRECDIWEDYHTSSIQYVQVTPSELFIVMTRMHSFGARVECYYEW